MKIAVVYNRDSQAVINLFGRPNQEKIGMATIRRIADALRAGGHHVLTLEGDKDLIDKLEHFMPRVVKGERPGLVFNLSYGIQGQARYTHVPSILEMVGIPYVGSGPLAHSLALDKVVSKVIFRQNGLPTPDFAVLKDPDFEMPDLAFPAIVKPKNEAVSFGIQVVNDEVELRAAADAIFEGFQQPVLAEQYIEGREINVGILGNSPPEAFPPVALTFGEGGPNIYTYEDKTRRSGREIGFEAPAKLPKGVSEEAQKIAVEAFNALGCYDCARVDIRLDQDSNVYILEINSLPSMGEHGSYTVGAELVGLDFTGLVNRLVEVASARYFGTPHPPAVSAKEQTPQEVVFRFLTERRDLLEREVEKWVGVHSRSYDHVGIRGAASELDERFREMAMRPVKELTELPTTWAWETAKGLDGGTLLIGHLDVPLGPDFPAQGFRRDPEWLYGEGVSSSRASLVMMEFALRALRYQRRLRSQKIGVLYYADEGHDCALSADVIRQAGSRVSRVLELRPGSAPYKLVVQRRGLRRYEFRAEGEPRRLGSRARRPELAQLVYKVLQEFSALTDRKEKLAVTAADLQTHGFPMMHPHAFEATILLSYLDPAVADTAEKQMKEVLAVPEFRWRLEVISDRPPMLEGRAGTRLTREYQKVARSWEIPCGTTSSVWPSAAGLISGVTATLGGVGPIGRDLYTPHESVQRISLMQRTLLLAQFLARDLR